MTSLILRLYDYMRSHRTLAVATAVAVVAVMSFGVKTLSYKEDISDFLPLESSHQDAMRVYQDVSGADRLFAIVSCSDTTESGRDTIVAAVATFVEDLSERDSLNMAADITAGVDMDKASETLAFAYANIPYFIGEADYARFDSLLADDDYVEQQLHRDKQMLMFPVGGLLEENMQSDPLNLFTPIVSRMRQAQEGVSYELYEGCIFSPDMRRAIVMVKSPFGSSETEHNGQLLKLLDTSARQTQLAHPTASVHLTGGPAIAVENATQIKTDSLLSVSVAVTLILILLYTSLRSVRNMLLIVLSIAFGWLFAMGGLSLVHNNVSIIVIGISSVIIGIAVNYPLHLVSHLRHTPDVRTTLREIAAPLIVGNITTVGAFLALVPLQSVALRDLGVFSSLLLVGTILFVLLYLPHIVKPAAHNGEINSHSGSEGGGLVGTIANMSYCSNRWVVVAVCIATVVLGYFSTQTSFDSNISHINYMTNEQRADMEYFAEMMEANAQKEKLYVVAQDSTLDAALDKNLMAQPAIDSLIATGLVANHRGCAEFLPSQAEQRRRLDHWQTFKRKYAQRLRTELQTKGVAMGFTHGSFDAFLDILNTDYKQRPTNYFAPIAQTLYAQNLSTDSVNGRYAVVDLLNVAPERLDSVRTIANNSLNGLFAFDVKSMNSTIADSLSDNFNYIGWVCSFIVFFFLWLSLGSLELAIISFIPMAVSWLWILGLMALFGIQFNIVNVILATFIFGQGDDYTIFMTEGAIYEYAYRKKMLASYKHSIILSALIMFIGIGSLIIAKHPALRSLAEVTVIGMASVVLMACLFPVLIFRWLVTKNGTYRKRPVSIAATLRRGIYICIGKRNMRLVPGVRLNVIGNADAIKVKPLLVVCNGNEEIVERVLRLNRGTQLVSLHNVGDEMLRDSVVPVVVHGVDYVLPQGDFQMYEGTITISIEPAHRFADVDSLASFMEARRMDVAATAENAAYFAPFVIDRYRYKGADILATVRKNLKRNGNYAATVDCCYDDSTIEINDAGYGELPLLMALTHKDKLIVAHEPDADKLAVARYSVEGIDNLKYI